MKDKIKTWRRIKNEESNRKHEELITKIEKIDIDAKFGVANPGSMETRKHLHKELMEIEYKRILDIKQKARCKWELEGDENLGFFHGLINKNLRSQRISESI